MSSTGTYPDYSELLSPNVMIIAGDFNFQADCVMETGRAIFCFLSDW